MTHQELVDLLLQEVEHCHEEWKLKKPTLEDDQFQTGFVGGLTYAISLIRAAERIGIVSIPHGGRVS